MKRNIKVLTQYQSLKVGKILKRKNNFSLDYYYNNHSM